MFQSSAGSQPTSQRAKDSEKWQGEYGGIFELSALSDVAESGGVDASGGRQPVLRFSRRNPTASSEATSSRRSSIDMAAVSSRCMGAPRPACADASAGRAFAHNDLRSAAGELSGVGESSTLRVNSVLLLHYLPPTSWKCPIRGGVGGERYGTSERDEHEHPTSRSCASESAAAARCMRPLDGVSLRT